MLLSAEVLEISGELRMKRESIFYFTITIAVRCKSSSAVSSQSKTVLFACWFVTIFHL